MRVLSAAGDQRALEQRIQPAKTKQRLDMRYLITMTANDNSLGQHDVEDRIVAEDCGEASQRAQHIQTSLSLQATAS